MQQLLSTLPCRLDSFLKRLLGRVYSFTFRGFGSLSTPINHRSLSCWSVTSRTKPPPPLAPFAKQNYSGPFPDATLVGSVSVPRIAGGGRVAAVSNGSGRSESGRETSRGRTAARRGFTTSSLSEATTSTTDASRTRLRPATRPGTTTAVELGVRPAKPTENRETQRAVSNAADTALKRPAKRRGRLLRNITEYNLRQYTLPRPSAARNCRWMSLLLFLCL